MSWRDRLLKASFRGVPFYLDESELVGERRLAVHEFLTSDRFGTEDLGRRPKQIAVQGYLVGPDYDIDRNELIEAFDQQGPGTLVIGTYGEQLQAKVIGQYSFSERRKAGSYASFRATFIEHVIKLDRDLQRVTQKRVLASYEEVIRITRTPPRDLLTLAKEARAQVRSVLGTVLGVVAKVRELNDYAQELLAVAEGIAGDVFAVYEEINDLFGLFENTIIEAGAKFQFYRDLFRMETETNYSGSGFVATRRRRAGQVLGQDIRAGAAASIAATAAREAFTTQDQVEARILEVNALVEEMVLAPDTRPELVVALRAVRGDLEAYLRQIALDLPTIATIDVPDTTSLRLSYRMGGDLTRSEAIIRRNRIRNPLLISGLVKVRSSA